MFLKRFKTMGSMWRLVFKETEVLHDGELKANFQYTNGIDKVSDITCHRNLRYGKRKFLLALSNVESWEFYSTLPK